MLELTKLGELKQELERSKTMAQARFNGSQLADHAFTLAHHDGKYSERADKIQWVNTFDDYVIMAEWSEAQLTNDDYIVTITKGGQEVCRYCYDSKEKRAILLQCYHHGKWVQEAVQHEQQLRLKYETMAVQKELEAFVPLEPEEYC